MRNVSSFRKPPVFEPHCIIKMNWLYMVTWLRGQSSRGWNLNLLEKVENVAKHFMSILRQKTLKLTKKKTF